MAKPTTTVLDLNGAWAIGGVPGPFITVSGNAISVDMSAFQRPFAAGSVLGSSNIKVTFGDDNTYTATLIPGQPGAGSPDIIRWSNNTTWTKVPLLATTLIDLNGKWASFGTTEPVINVSVSGRFISLDLSSLGRPPARGYIVDCADIFVDFPDDKGHTGRLQFPGTIHWSGGSAWQKVIRIPPSISMLWETAGSIKTLFVTGNGFTPDQVTIELRSGNFEIAHFTAFPEDSGIFTASQVITCTGGETLHVSVFKSSDLSTPVVTSATLCPQIPP